MTDPVEAREVAAALTKLLYETDGTAEHILEAAPMYGLRIDVVPTGDAGLDAAARGAWHAWDDAMEHADEDGFVDGEWWAALVGAMDALYARLSSSDTER